MRFLLVAPAFLILLALGSCGDDDDAADATSAQREARDAPTPTDAQLEQLSATNVAGYSISESGPTLLGSAVTYLADAKTAGGAQLYVRASLTACDTFICSSLDPKDHDSPDAQANLKSILPRAHIDNPGLRWEWGDFAFSSSATGLFVYSLSYIETRNADGSVSRSSANSFRAWYHNGGTYLTFEVFSRHPDSVMSQADLESRMSRAEAENAARDVFAALEPNFPR